MDEVLPDPDVIDVPIELLGTCVPWFERFLRDNKLQLRSGTALSKAIEALRDLRAQGKAGQSLPSTAALRYYQDAHGADFLTKLLHMGVHAGLRIPRERLVELLAGDPIVTRPGASTSPRNHTWEVLVACAAATCSTDVRFAEPDVVCTFRELEFVVPVKTIYSESKLLHRIKEGVEQAEVRAHGGVVIVDVVELLPHQRLFDNTAGASFASGREAGRWLRQWETLWLGQYPLEHWVSSLRTRTQRPIGVAFFLPLVFVVNGLPRACWLVNAPLRSQSGPDYEFAAGVLQCFDRILTYAPDA